MSTLYLTGLIYISGILAYILIDNLHFRWYMKNVHGIHIDYDHLIAPSKEGLLSWIGVVLLLIFWHWDVNERH